ncbi:MAG: TIM barrel protein [Mangrovibacterium sp.]|nr:TIM barrel protein [Mangrovibacterium sp.]
MDAGISSYTFTWAIGVPGQEPLRRMSAFDLIQKAADFQVPVVQIADNLPLHSLSDEKIREIGRFAAERNIRIEPGAQEMTDEMLERYIGIAVQLNAPLIRFVIDGPDFQPSLDDAHQIIRTALPALEEKGVVLAIENHDRFKAREFKAMVEKAASSQVGICLDTVNSMGAGEGLETVIGLLAPLTVNLHVKEFCVERVFHKMGFVIEGKPLGTGMLPLGELLAKVNPRCRSAILEQWTPPEATIEATVRKEADWADESINYLKSIL